MVYLMALILRYLVSDSKKNVTPLSICIILQKILDFGIRGEPASWLKKSLVFFYSDKTHPSYLEFSELSLISANITQLLSFFLWGKVVFTFLMAEKYTLYEKMSLEKRTTPCIYSNRAWSKKIFIYFSPFARLFDLLQKQSVCVSIWRFWLRKFSFLKPWNQRDVWV